MSPSKLLFHMNGWSWFMLHNFLNHSNKQQWASVSPRPGTSSSQPRYTAWFHLGISKPSSTSSSHLRLSYSLVRVALGKTQVGADHGLHDLGNLKACSLSRQLQTTSEQKPPFTYTADPPQRAVVDSQWSQPLIEADCPE